MIMLNSKSCINLQKSTSFISFKRLQFSLLLYVCYKFVLRRGETKKHQKREKYDIHEIQRWSYSWWFGLKKEERYKSNNSNVMPEWEELEGQFSCKKDEKYWGFTLVKEIASRLVPNNASHFKCCSKMLKILLILLAIAGSPIGLDEH